MSTEPVWPKGYEKVVLDTCGSTNDEALARAPDLGRPTWVMAHHQTAARGRRGKAWEMPEGSFAATLALRPTGTAGWAALRTFLAACALFETLALYTERSRLAFKWPNDVLLDGGKVAGILLETSSRQGQIEWLTIGFGLNLARAPEGVRDAAFPPVALYPASDRTPTPEDILIRLAGHYATEESILEQLGFDPIREKWLRHAARLGEQITARLPNEEIIGRFDSVDEAGRLVLATPDGERRISAADIFF